MLSSGFSLILADRHGEYNPPKNKPS